MSTDLLNSPTLLVTSMPLGLLAIPPDATRKNHLLRTAAPMPLFVLYDPDPAFDAAAVVASLPPTVLAEDLFALEPRLETLMQNGSAIERWYGLQGFREPNFKSSFLQTGKLLVRKCAAIALTLRRVGPRCSLVVWADTDVEFKRPLDAAFVAWASQHEFAYTPLPGNGYHKRQWSQPDRAFALDKAYATHDHWIIESGFMTFVPNQCTRRLASAAVELYEGGLLALAAHCGLVDGDSHLRFPFRDRGSHACPLRVARNLFINDVFVWSLLARLAEGQFAAPPGFACCLCADRNATYGWFAYEDRLAPARPGHPRVSPFSLQPHYIVHHTFNDGAFNLRFHSSKQHFQTSLRQGAVHNVTCTAANASKCTDHTLLSTTFNPYTPSADPRLLAANVDRAYWRNKSWDSPELGMRLAPRVAACACTHDAHADPAKTVFCQYRGRGTHLRAYLRHCS